MSPAARRPTATDPRFVAAVILQRVESSGAWAGPLLDHAERRIDDPRDAGLLHELVLGVLRHRRWIDHVLDGLASVPTERMDPPVRTALRIGAYSLLWLERVPGFAAVDRSVELVRHHQRGRATGFVNGILRRLAREIDHWRPVEPETDDVEALARYASHPSWWVRRLVERRGWQEAKALLDRCNRPAPTVLRVNRLRVSADRLRERLEESGVSTEPCRYLADALRVTGGSLIRSRVLSDGAAWVQDQASQLAGELVGPGPFERAIDLCAAPGGKALQLSERLADDGLLVTVDRHAGRLRRLRRNLDTAGRRRVAVLQADMRAGHHPIAGRFDRVLLDAPCSGSGTMRRHPELRWRLQRDGLKLFAARQRALLESAGELVAAGGRLVYSVCSMEPEEGKSVIEAFLGDHREFRVADPRGELPPEAHGCLDAKGYLVTSPLQDGMDGFFAVRLDRSGTGR